MEKDNILKLKDVERISTIIKNACTRIYHPGISFREFIQNHVDYVGDRNATIGAAVLSVLIILCAFALFSVLFAVFFSIVLIIIVFVAAKLIFYEPKEVAVRKGEKIIFSFVKDIHISGETELIVYPQSDYHDEKNTYAVIQLYSSFSILDCKNITAIICKSYRDVVIQFFYPIGEVYEVHAAKNGHEIAFDIIEKTADSCHINFLRPVPKFVKINFKPV